MPFRHFAISTKVTLLILELATFLNSPIQEYLQLVRSNTSIKQQVNNIAIELVSSYLTKVEYYFIDVEGLEHVDLIHIGSWSFKDFMDSLLLVNINKDIFKVTVMLYKPFFKQIINDLYGEFIPNVDISGVELYEYVMSNETEEFKDIKATFKKVLSIPATTAPLESTFSTYKYCKQPNISDAVIFNKVVMTVDGKSQGLLLINFTCRDIYEDFKTNQRLNRLQQPQQQIQRRQPQQRNPLIDQFIQQHYKEQGQQFIAEQIQQAVQTKIAEFQQNEQQLFQPLNRSLVEQIIQQQVNRYIQQQISPLIQQQVTQQLKDLLPINAITTNSTSTNAISNRRSTNTMSNNQSHTNPTSTNRRISNRRSTNTTSINGRRANRRSTNATSNNPASTNQSETNATSNNQ